MNKTVQILLLAFCCVSATTQWGGGYGNYGGYGGYSNGRWTGGYTGGWGNYGGYTGDINGNVDADWTGAQDTFTGNLGAAVSAGNGGVYSCQDAIEKVNGAFEQLVEDVTGQVNEWIVYSDLDAVDEVSYYLGGACDVKQLDVVTQGSPACRGLGQLLKAVVQQGESGSFRGDYQQGAQLSEQALSLGQGVEKGCQVRVVKKQQQQPRPQAPQQAKQAQQANNEEEANEQEEQVERQQTQRKIQQDNFIVRSEKTKTAKHGKQGKHAHKGFASTWGNWGQNYGGQYVGQNAGGQKQQKGSQDVNQYGKQYESQYGGKYSSEGKEMTKLASPGQGKKYGTDQADLSHKINQEYTEKYGKKNKYQEKYQKNNEEENNVESGEGLDFNLDDYMVWM